MENTMTWEERRRVRKIENAKRVLENSYAPVEKVPSGVDNKFYIINPVSGTKLSEVSKRYTLIKNERIFQPFVDKFGLENIDKFFTYSNGKYAHMEIKTGREFDLGTPERPDIVKERIVIQNSYNKTKSFAFMFGAFRLVCSNGMYTGKAVLNYRKIHVGEIPVEKLIAEVMNRYQYNSFEIWNNLKEIPMTVEQEISMLENFKAFNLKPEKEEERYNMNNRIKYTARRLIEKPESADNCRNGWGLYNQINRAIDYNVGGKSKIQQRINANKRAEGYLEKVLLRK